ncbi:MAG: YncE family protein [Acidobacteriota bacterium]|nr:YncE family protein [Acidobacteriota bacterium]
MKGVRFLAFVSLAVVLTCSSLAVADDPTVVATVQLGQPTCCSLTGVAVNPAANRIYVADLAGDVLHVVDGATQSPVAEVPILGRPFGVAVNPFTGRIYASSIDDSAIYVIDAATHRVIATIPVPHSPLDLVIDYGSDRLYAAHPAASAVSEIDLFTNSVTEIRTEPQPQGLGLDTGSSKVWVGHESACVSIVEPGAEAEAIILGENLLDVAVNPLAGQAYACDRDGNTVYAIDTKTQRVSQIGLAGSPRSVAVNPITDRVYVALSDDRLQVLAGLRGTVEDTIAVGDGPMDVAVNPLTEFVYVANFIDGTLQIISDPDNYQPPSKTIVGYLNELLVELSTSIDGAKLVEPVLLAIAVLTDGDPDNDFMAAERLDELMREAAMTTTLPADQVERIQTTAGEILSMFFGG